MGDFTGFTFGGYHSADDLGITRVSGGDRYDEQLHPEIKDRTAEVPGLNGEYYFGSDFGPRTIDIEFAFDHVTEEQFRKIRRVFGTKHIQKLVFDERPYKYYIAKIESPVELSYVCFNEPKKELVNFNGIYGETQVWRDTIQKERVYKGEGKLSFICYFPFAKSNFKVLPEAGNDYYEGSEEWAVSSGILSTDEYTQYDTYTSSEEGTGAIKVYNAGDLPTGFRLYCPFASAQSTYNLTLAYTEGQDLIAALQITNLKPIGSDIGIIINTDTGLITGVASEGDNSDSNATFTTSGNLYNRYVSSGYFFKLNPNVLVDAVINTQGNFDNLEIYYDYLYF